jgi:putative transcriptional regulator
MRKKKPTAGERMIASVTEALAFAAGEDNGCVVHIPEDIDVKAIRDKVAMSKSEFAHFFGIRKRTLEHWEHGRRVPTGPVRASVTVISREPEAVRCSLLTVAPRQTR